MRLGEARDYLLAKDAATEDMPFGPDVLVFRIGGKIFALINLERLPLSMNLKCDPERAIELREENSDVLPGYHMNKRHWNTIVLPGRLSTTMIHDMIDHSYDLVFSSLPQSTRKEFAEL